MAANHRKTTANTARAARRVLLALALASTASAMSPAVHDKLDATINDLKGKPETVNKRLRYKLDSSAVAASADGAAAIAGKIADGVACKNPHRLFRPSKTHEKQHKAHGASQCPTASLDSAPPAPAHWQCAVTWQCAGDGERSRRRVHHPHGLP